MKYFITGITGTLGQAVTKILLKNPKNTIIGYSRDELKQSQLPKHKRLTLVLGDVRDKRRVVESTRGVDLIFHFAALKRVDKLEENPEEAIATNVMGTENILHAQRVNKIKRVVLSSTDKACYSINTYGHCKALAEKLVLRNPNNIVCRYGNVLASRGSVVPVFVNSLKDGKYADITHTQMTRFFIRIEDAAKFVVRSSMKKNGGLNIPKMKASYMTDVVRAISEILGIPTKAMTINLVGIRPGEKIHECLRMDHEGESVSSLSSDHFTQKELIKLLRPVVESLS